MVKNIIVKRSQKMNSLKIKIWMTKNKKSWHIWLVLIVISLLFTLFPNKEKAQQESSLTRNLDTYIPEGFVLAPVELSNGSSLDGLLESKGVVDLYTGDPARKQAEKVAESVKIIRSPRNPSYFAVLVPEDKAGFLIQRFQAFYAVIQNPSQKKRVYIQPLRKKRKRTIIIDLDNSSGFN